MLAFIAIGKKPYLFLAAMVSDLISIIFIARTDTAGRFLGVAAREAGRRATFVDLRCIFSGTNFALEAQWLMSGNQPQ